MAKKANAMVDIATLTGTATVGGHLIAAGKYFIADNGVVKTASKKVKKVVLDTRGNEMVTLDTEAGATVAVYIADLLRDAFNYDDKDLFNEKALAAAKSGKGRQTRSSKVTVQNTATGQIFNSFAQAARDAGCNYDKFYNAFYTKGLTSAKIDGVTYSLISAESENTEGVA